MAITQLGFMGKANDAINGFYQKNINKTMNKILSYVSTLRRFNTPQDVAIGLPDPFKVHQWEAYFPSIAIDNGIGAGVKAVSYTPIVEDINFSLPQISTTKLDFGQRNLSVPNGSDTTGTVSVHFYCDNRMQIVNYFNTWRTQVRDDYGLYGYPSDYKKDAFIYGLGFKSIIPVFVFKFKGLYPQSLTSINFSNDPAARLSTTITFSYDDIIPEPVKLGQIAATYLDGNIAGIMANQAQSSVLTAGVDKLQELNIEGKIFG